MSEIVGNIAFPISNIPFHSNVVNFYEPDAPDTSNGDARKLKQDISFPYEGFFNSLHQKVDSFNDRAFDYILRNPDFNLLSANGTAPVTPAQGTNYEVIQKWFLMNSDVLNNYTITPTAYTQIPTFGTGSNYYLNVSIPTLNSPFYLYNQNYSTTGQFISSSETSGKTVTFSSIIRNNTSAQQKVRFSALLNGISQTEQGGGIFLAPNAYNLIATSINIPDLKNTVSDSSAYTQFQFSFENGYNMPMDIDIFYLKAEISNLATYLQVNHVLEQMICANLT